MNACAQKTRRHPDTQTFLRRVCAIVVTFRPTSDDIANVIKLAAHFTRLVVIDNGSPLTHVLMLRGASISCGFTLIESSSNLGIAAALNIGINWARRQRSAWVMMFDQDSTITEGFLDGMSSGCQANAMRDEVAIFCPKHIDRKSGSTLLTAPAKEGGLEQTCTSGSLIPMWVFDECGPLVEELVIDQVDYEYALRVRSRGYRILECPEAVLIHSVGDMKFHRFFGKLLCTTANHNPLRRYYLVRNRVWMLRKFWKSYPKWCWHSNFSTFVEMAKLLLFEDRRWPKFKYTMLGLRDGFLNRMGKTVEL